MMKSTEAQKRAARKYYEKHKDYYREKTKENIKKIRRERREYKRIIDEAIEYYKTHQQECVIGRNKDDRLIRDYYLPAQCSKILLNILQGSDKE